MVLQPRKPGCSAKWTWGVPPGKDGPGPASSLMKVLERAADESEAANRKMELLRLMVKEPNIPVNELKEVRVPTLVIVGEDDMIKKSHSRKIYKKLPAAKLVTIPGNHFIANENYDLFNLEVVNFLEENRKTENRKKGAS